MEYVLGGLIVLLLGCIVSNIGDLEGAVKELTKVIKEK